MDFICLDFRLFAHPMALAGAHYLSSITLENINIDTEGCVNGSKLLRLFTFLTITENKVWPLVY
jgi:hypothetical protein